MTRALTVVALTAAAVALSTGGAVAGSLITGAQIKDGTITSKDVKNKSLASKDLSKKAVAEFSKPGPKGSPGLVRAYGHVASGGQLSQASPGVSVSHPDGGVYCISGPGLDPATTVALVTPDYDFGSTQLGNNASQSFVEYGGGSAVCPASSLSVRTFVRSFVAINGELHSTNLSDFDQAFVFVVP